ncbi:SMI1/KNR4 family protein [Streptomyces sp. NPDC059605]|uniref:SMI1/KNR4 family protein n=1 Tax=unclassified Streptomyces TaxID=2593676 RepID=UPI0036C720E9
MDEQELLAAVDALVTHDGWDAACGPVGDGADPARLPTDELVDFRALSRVLSSWYGQARNLAMGGYVDPTVTARTGAPLLAPFGDRVVEMRAWNHAGRWIGCGAVRTDGAVRPVVLVAGWSVPRQPGAEAVSLRPDERAVPGTGRGKEKWSSGPEEGTTWVDRVVAVTGWTRERGAAVDWAAVESRLGTALPGDYKELVERFGHGDFDDYLGLLIADGPPGSLDLVEFNEFWARAAAENGGGSWRPYRLHPAPGGLLQWASTEQQSSFYWLTEGTDPDRWPILVTDDDYGEWDRFDGSTAEFVHRLLTDPRFPRSTARHFDRHWFTSYENPDGEEDARNDRPPVQRFEQRGDGNG